MRTGGGELGGREADVLLLMMDDDGRVICPDDTIPLCHRLNALFCDVMKDGPFFFD